MRRNFDHKYADISSFEDFHLEKERLIFRSKLAEARLNLAYIKVTHFLSVSGMLYGLAKDIILPKISEFLKEEPKKEDKKDERQKTKAKSKGTKRAQRTK